MKPRSALIALFAAMSCGVATAQLAKTITVVPPQNVLQLSASGRVAVQQDLLTLTLTAMREGADAAAVQAQLRKAVDAALTEVKRTAQPGQMDVRSGNFGVYPSYGGSEQINAWQGRAEVVLEGRDFQRITEAAARVPSMTIGNLRFGLSREQRARVEGEAQAQAIERFKAKAADVVRAFGFSGYTLREINIGSADSEIRPSGYGMDKVNRMSTAAPVSVEAGISTVEVSVSGSVQAH